MSPARALAPSPRLPAVLPLLALLAACVETRPRALAAGEDAALLREIRVAASDIYEPEDLKRSFLARWINATHHKTRESVVRREIWLKPGESIDAEDVRELERNLRSTGLFAGVTTRLLPVEEGWVDLEVETRDKLSIGIGASGSFVGAVASLGARLSESNLAGTGDRIVVAFTENSEGEFRGAMSYRDRHVLGTWITGELQVGRTDDGDFAALSLARPFRFLADRRSWSLYASTADSARDYYDAGETVAEVPQSIERAGGSVAWRHGPRDAYLTTGLVASHSSNQYGAAEGPAAPSIDVPGDTTRNFGGVQLGYRSVDAFREVRRLDTLGFVQDVTLGTSVTAVLGAQHVAETGESDHVEPTGSLGTSLVLEPAPETFLALDVSGNVRLRAGDAQGWRTSAEVRAFELGFEPHTLAFRAGYEEAFEEDGLPVQLIVGEGEGLRGYPAREFTGERVLRLNLEDRIPLGARVGSFDLGAVAFFDVAWIEDRGEGLGRPYRSVGFGLRVGSDALLGDRVVRIDLAFPLDERDGESFDPLVSLSIGQVFGL